MSTNPSDLPSQMAPYITMTWLDEPVPVAKGPFRLIGTAEGILEAVAADGRAGTYFDNR